MTVYHQPASLEDALAALAPGRADDGARVLAGATDLYPAEASRAAWLQVAPASPVVDISRIASLRGIVVSQGEVAFGALTTWTDIIDATLPRAFAGLQAAATQVGGRQIQNRGTIGGNLCNASPAADGVPPLLALDAELELASLAGSRRVPLGAFVLGNRRTALRPGELVTRVIVPRPPDDERGTFLKLGARSYLVISMASVAANVRLGSDGRIVAARIALGACSAAPVRLTRLETLAVGRHPDALEITLDAQDGVRPIDDVRASAAYRLRAAEVLVHRALLACCGSRQVAA